MSEKLILKCGDSITQTVQAIFPEGGLGDLASFARGAVSQVIGGGLMNLVSDAALIAQRRIYGGILFPGVLRVYDTRVSFSPTWAKLLPIYKGIEEISIPAETIRSVSVERALLVVRVVVIDFESGVFKIAATFDARTIENAIRQIIR